MADDETSAQLLARLSSDRDTAYRQLLYAFCDLRGLDVETTSDGWSDADDEAWDGLMVQFRQKYPIS